MDCVSNDLLDISTHSLYSSSTSSIILSLTSILPLSMLKISFRITFFTPVSPDISNLPVSYKSFGILVAFSIPRDCSHIYDFYIENAVNCTVTGLEIVDSDIKSQYAKYIQNALAQKNNN